MGDSLRWYIVRRVKWSEVLQFGKVKRSDCVVAIPRWHKHQLHNGINEMNLLICRGLDHGFAILWKIPAFLQGCRVNQCYFGKCWERTGNCSISAPQGRLQLTAVVIKLKWYHVMWQRRYQCWIIHFNNMIWLLMWKQRLFRVWQRCPSHPLANFNDVNRCKSLSNLDSVATLPLKCTLQLQPFEFEMNYVGFSTCWTCD